MSAERGTVHVVGAGLAGLAAAVTLATAGERVRLYEAARAAGGRCRSYHDSTLDLTIDNGNHLLLSGNGTAFGFLEEIGGLSAVSVAEEAAFDFADPARGERWRLRINAGRLPWWVLVPSRRVPGTRATDYLGPLGILRNRDPAKTIGEVMDCEGPLYERLWRPVLLAALNTEPKDSSALLAEPVLRETLGAGGRACRPVVATGGLSPAFVDPALALLARHDVALRTGARLRGLTLEGDRVASLLFGDGEVELGPADALVLAVPPWVAEDLVPGLTVPNEHRGILNAHFRVVPPAGAPPLLGLVGTVSEWLFAYPDRLSVTISGADRLFEIPREEMAATIWAEIRRALDLPEGPMPVWQIVKEKRATFAALPSQAARRPKPRTGYQNLVLAGDWTDTGLPATIEGAIRSGRIAASVLRDRDGRPRPAVA